MSNQQNSKSIQIAEDYRLKLSRQHLKAGSKVGSVRKLMQMYDISLATADKVLNILAEQDVVYRTPSCGTFVKHDLKGDFLLGFTENDYCPSTSGDFRRLTLRQQKKVFREENVEPYYVSYNDLLTPQSAEKVFAEINTLLLRGGFVDAKTLPQLRTFSGPVVQVEAARIPGEVEPLLTSWILPDYEFLLRELAEDIEKFRKLLIFSAGHPNALYQERIIRKVFPDMKIETVYFQDKNLHLETDNYFQHHQDDYENVLLIMLSGWFSASLRRVYGDKKLPEILEFDNFEKTFADTGREAVFTAVDPNFPELYQQGVRLLKQLFETGSQNRHIVLVKPDLVIRKTFVPENYIKNIQQRRNHDV